MWGTGVETWANWGLQKEAVIPSDVSGWIAIGWGGLGMNSKFPQMVISLECK